MLMFAVSGTALAFCGTEIGDNRMYIIGGMIKTMAGRDIPDGCIHIKDGKIAEIGSRKEVPLQPAPNERVIEISDGLIMPGLIEAHCHMGITEEKKGMEGDDCNETVDPITPYLRAIDAVNTMDAAFDDAVRAGITSAMIGPGSSNVVGGQFAFLKTRGRRVDDLIVKAPAAMKVAFGENPKVNYSGEGKSPSTRMAIAAMLREELTKAEAYAKRKKQAADNGKSFEEDFRMECWLPVLDGEIPLKAHVHRVDDIFTAIRIAREFSLKMTLDHCSEGHMIAAELAQEGFPAIVGPDLASRNKIEVQNMAFKTVGVLNQAGVMTAVTTDHPVSLIQSLPLCAGLAVKSGLDMEEGYKAITIHPAIICGVSDRVGSLEPGKDADIAIFTGNPMEVFTRTLYTIIDGQVVYEAGKPE
jgi:imidazolonepropionase-like amidohydrolase